MKTYFTLFLASISDLRNNYTLTVQPDYALAKEIAIMALES